MQFESRCCYAVVRLKHELQLSKSLFLNANQCDVVVECSAALQHLQSLVEQVRLDAVHQCYNMINKNTHCDTSVGI